MTTKFNTQPAQYSISFALTYALQSMFVQKLQEVPKINVAVYRSCLQITFFLPILQLFFKDSIQTQNFVKMIKIKELRKGIFYRVFWGYVAIMFLFASLRYISIGDSSCIRALVGPVTAVLAYFTIKESINLFQTCLMVLSVIGMVFIAQPWIGAEGHEHLKSLNFDQDINEVNFTDVQQQSPLNPFETRYSAVLGSALCFISVLGNSIATIAIRGMGKKVHFWLLTFFHALFGALLVLPSWAILGFINLTQLWNTSFTKHDIFHLIAISICGTLAQISKKLALENEKAVIVQMIGNVQVVFCYVLQYFVLGKIPNVYSGIGAVFILVSVFGLSFGKLAKERSLKN